MENKNKRPGYDKFVKDEFKSKPITKIKDADEKGMEVKSSLVSLLKSKMSSIKFSSDSKRAFLKALSKLEDQEDMYEEDVEDYVNLIINGDKYDSSYSPENIMQYYGLVNQEDGEDLYDDLSSLAKKYKNKYTNASIKQWQQEFAKIVVKHKDLYNETYGDSIKKPKPIVKTKDDWSSKDFPQPSSSQHNQITKSGHSIWHMAEEFNEEVRKIITKKKEVLGDLEWALNRLASLGRSSNTSAFLYQHWKMTEYKEDLIPALRKISNRSPLFKTILTNATTIVTFGEKKKDDYNIYIKALRNIESSLNSLKWSWRKIFAKEIEGSKEGEIQRVASNNRGRGGGGWESIVVPKKKDSIKKPITKSKDSTTISKAKKAKKVVVTKTITFY